MALPELDPIIHQANRLKVITLLYRNRELAVTTIRDLLGFTDGNLASHLERLQAATYVKVGRVLAGVLFELHAKITEEGSRAFRDYLAALREYVEAAPPAPEASTPSSTTTGTARRTPT